MDKLSVLRIRQILGAVGWGGGVACHRKRVICIITRELVCGRIYIYIVLRVTLKHIGYKSNHISNSI